MSLKNPKIFFISNLKEPGCASKQDGLELATIRYAGIVGGSEKFQKYADVIYGWSLKWIGIFLLHENSSQFLERVCRVVNSCDSLSVRLQYIKPMKF